MRVDFYHLTTAPLERALPQIAEKVLAGGGRLLIVADEERRRDALDRLLWEYARDSFLPHAQAGTGDDAGQPVLIAPDLQAGNGARHVLLADGCWREGALAFERAFLFFDDERLGDARAAWKGLADREGVERRYWRQKSGGGWEKAA